MQGINQAMVEQQGIYPAMEPKEDALAVLTLISMRHDTNFNVATVDKLRRKKSVSNIANVHNNPTSRKRPRTLPTEASSAMVMVIKKTTNLDARILPGQQPPLPIPTPEFVMKLIHAYIPPRIPPVPGLNTEAIRIFSKPFEKQLTDSDLRGGQNRLSFNKEDAENCLYPLLKDKVDDLVRGGIEVKTFGPDGKEFDMTFKIWASNNMHVLNEGWKEFYQQYQLEMLQDFVTVWMFQKIDTQEFCFVITFRRLPVFELLKRSRLIK